MLRLNLPAVEPSDRLTSNDPLSGNPSANGVCAHVYELPLKSCLKPSWGIMSDDQIEKLYYSIGEVSDLIGYEPHVLRYWEEEFDVLNPRKNRAGRRIYTKEDVATIERIRHLLKDEKYTIEGARQAIERDEAERKRYAEVADDLKELRSFLKTLRAQLE